MLAFAIVLLSSLQQRPAPRPEVSYDIAFPNAVHHEAVVTVTYERLPQAPLELRFSRSSPGRYALHEFAKNVYNVSAVDKAGRALTITRPNEHQWNVMGHNGYARVTYTLFADHADGTYSGIDATHAHLNMPATFMFARGTLAWLIRVRFNRPAGTSWKIATQLAPTADSAVFTAPDFQYFADSPTEISDHSERRWVVAENGTNKQMRLAIHHTGTAIEVDSFAARLKRIVREQQAVFGELPAFDHGAYTFIADYLPWVFGDGMEHRNSTILANQGSLARDLNRIQGTAAHEFFHSWNVERLRPRGLEPFDFERANMSDALWFAEGVTSYYGPLSLKRAGLNSLDDYAQGIGGNINSVLTDPGRNFFSPAEMSMQAPFVDAATAIDADNRVNTFISYYTYGAAIGVGLDLLLRTERNTTLDEFMRVMWQRFGRTEVPYTLDDWRATLGQVAQDSRWADAFFSRHIVGRDPIDYGTLLARAGLLLRKAGAGMPTLGDVRFAHTRDSAHVLIASQTLIGSPLYEAGLDRGDVVLALDGKTVARESDIAAILKAHKIGDRVLIAYEQRGARKSAVVRVGERTQLEVVTNESAGLAVTPPMAMLRRQWLGTKASN